MGVLTVYLDKVTDLKDGDGVGRSDPYVKFHLEQDNLVFDKNYGKQESTHKKNTCNPEYGETFTFEEVPSLNNLKLHIKVMDDDIGFDDKVGKCSVDLESLEPDAGGKHVQASLDGGGWFKEKALVYLKITYTE